MDLTSLLSILIHECALEPDRPLLVGVSGGPDSLCLLDILAHLAGQNQWGKQIIAAHFDHALRPTSASEAEQVSRMAGERGIPFILGRSDVHALAEEQKLSIEEAARTARYHFLFEQARQLKAQAVAVAHNADDQVETVLMHLLRGAGLGGLKGMPYRAVLPVWDETIPLVRPLLGVWRSEIEVYCRQHSLQPIQDASNQDTTFFRNRLRHQLLPTLQEYNPQAKELLWRTANNLAGDFEILEAATGEAWERCLDETALNHVILKVDELRPLPPGLLRRVLRRAVAFLRPELRDIDFLTIDRAANFLRSPSQSRRMELSEGLWVTFEASRKEEADYLVISDGLPLLRTGQFPQMLPGASLVLPIPGLIDLGTGWSIKSELIPTQDIPDFSRGDKNQAYLDAASLTLPLTLRPPRPGDRFQPLGMPNQSQKLSDFWINNHVPAAARAAYPLVFSGEQVVWIPAFRPAHSARISPSTRQVVVLRIFTCP